MTPTNPPSLEQCLFHLRYGMSLEEANVIKAHIDSLASTFAESAAEMERLTRYEKELEQLSEFVQSRHPVGEVKHIGLLEAVEAAKQVILEHEKQLAALRAPGGDVELLCETYWEWAHPSTQWRLVGNSQKENIRAGVEYVAARVRAPLLAQIADRDKQLAELRQFNATLLDERDRARDMLRQAEASCDELTKAKEAAERRSDRAYRRAGRAIRLGVRIHNDLVDKEAEADKLRSRLAEVERACTPILTPLYVRRLRGEPDRLEAINTGLLVYGRLLDLEAALRNTPADNPGKSS